MKSHFNMLLKRYQSRTHLLAGFYFLVLSFCSLTTHAQSHESSRVNLQVLDKELINENTLLKSIQEKEYEITYQSDRGKWQSPNRVHDNRAYYSPGQWTLVNRTASNANWELNLSTKGIYADGKLIHQPSKSPTVVELVEEINFIHDGYTEQYINNEEGIRQNFIIDSAPKKANELKVVLLYTGMDFYSGNEQELLFVNGQDTISYSGLKVWDHN